MCVFVLLGCQNNTNVLDLSVNEVSNSTCSVCPKHTPGEDTLQFINSVRRFVAKNVDTGLMPNEALKKLSAVDDQNLDLDRLFELFEADSAVALCVLTARINARILSDSGIEAYTYSFGSVEKNTAHTLNLVRYEENLIVVDPFINYTLMDSLGLPIDFIDFLSSVGTSTVPVYVSSDTVVTDILIDKQLQQKNYQIDSLINAPSCSDVAKTLIPLNASINKYQKSRCFECDKSNCFSFVERFENWLIQTTHLNSYHEGMVLKSSKVVGGENADKLDSLITIIVDAKSIK